MPQSAAGTGNLGLRYLRGVDDPGFARATEPRPLTFPRDHASHPEFRTEWWYFTGNLEGEDGGAYGFELTFFRVALQPSGPRVDSAWRTNQVWFAHLAVTDGGRGTFEAYERSAREALGLAGATASPVSVWVKDWKAERTGEGAAEHWSLSADEGGAGVTLDLATDRAPVLNGDAGLDPKGAEPGNASYYYSLPRLITTGFVRIAGKRVAVRGATWMDREWSTSALGGDTVGWDWFGLRLSDGSSLMYYRLRRHDGSASEFSSGTFVDAGGHLVHLRAGDVQLDAADSWRSEVTGVRYPIAWRLRIPSLRLTLDLSPYVREQELTLSVRYWEGAVRGSGQSAAGPVRLDGYLELAGY